MPARLHAFVPVCAGWRAHQQITMARNDRWRDVTQPQVTQVRAPIARRIVDGAT
jgi:hypothetical protein